jgi:undecaprenyl-diphosphatase
MAEQEIKQPIKKVTDAAQQAARAESAPAPERRYRAVIFQIAMIIVAIAFAILTVVVKASSFLAVDLNITRAVQSINFPAFNWLMILASWPGFPPQTFIITLLIILYVYLSGLHWESVMAIIAAVFTSGVNVLVKDLVQRPRPTPNLVNVFAAVSSYSFPSGHVMYYLGFFGFLWFLVFTLMKHSIRRTLQLVFLGVLIILVGVSRVYLGEHWASDVLGSYLLGTLTLVVIIRVYLWGKNRFFVRQPVAPEPVAPAKPPKK